ncbi:S-layer homology domain-containing protein [uncultured Megasphaera sp.]|uniref:S-layer homology domain-containing protein n=1 Tax=uncultured Megasphaera sp. TaxID=165188 RepID=UPI0026090741|nr:S-layer homology domain-containing protein [uncultured Megasphaera sp.]
MKKKIVTSLTAMMAVGAACAFAANPFVDVPTDSWAYKSVVELADAGVIQGVDGSYFQGERNITRYEAAEMVAKAMAHMDKASVEQRALINKLADEYADELNNLGVRVSALENRVGNVKLSGDARIRFQHQDSSESNAGYKNDASWDYRVRVRANAKVNDRTTVTYGISTDDINFADNGAASDNKNIFTDDAKVDYNFGGDHWNLSVGRTDTYVLGGENAYGFQYGDVFDRAELKYTNDHFAATAGYGKFKAGDIADTGNMDGVKTGYGELEGFFGGGRAAGSAVGVYYNDFTVAGGEVSEQVGDGFRADDLWGAYASVNFGKWNALANYEKINSNNSYLEAGNTKDPEVWIGKLTYGSADSDARGSWDAWVEYLNSDKGALLGGATNSWRDDSVLDNVKSWGVGIDYTLAKNVILTAAQTFGTQTKHGNAADPDEFTDVEINFLF